MLKVDEMTENLDVFEKEDFGMEALNELNFEGTLETFTVFVPTDIANLSRVPDDYDYDMETSHSTFFWDELLPTLIVYCLTFVLGLVGNVLIIFTIFRYRKMKSTTNVFLASLASSDLLLILFCIPVKEQMDTIRRRTEDLYKSSLTTANDHLKNWYFRWKNIKESVLMECDDELLEKEKKKREPSVKKIENLQPKYEKEKRRKTTYSKPKKKDLLHLDLKLLKDSSKTTPGSTEAKDIHKASKRTKKKESAFGVKQQRNSFLERTMPCLPSTWEHNNYLVVPNFSLNRTKKRRESRSKKSDKIRTETHPESDDEENEGLVRKENNKDKNVEVLYHQLNDFMKDRSNVSNDSGGEAVVIYQRQNRSNYYQPSTGDGCQFEQISFTGSCDETMDFTQSKPNLSEPLQNSSKEVYVARRRTRFFLDPQKRNPAYSDFHSAINFFQRGGSFEFNHFNSSVTKFIYKNPLLEEKIPFQRIQSVHHHVMLRKSKSTSKISSGFRLRQTAEKKLDLHREMIRVEKVSRKKFWESIEKSLNYRCAVAQMFSSQSFLPTNEPSNLITSTEDTGKSTNTFLKKNFVDELSSYQGVSTIISSTKTDSGRKTEYANNQQLSNSTIQQIKTLLDAILIKEEEQEEEMFLKRKFNRRNNSCNDSTVQTDISLYDTLDTFLSETTSKKLSEIESNLWSSEDNSKLHSLMAKLSEEIGKYSNLINQIKNIAEEKFLSFNSAKPSASGSIIQINKSKENSIPKEWPTSPRAVYPAFICPTSQTSPVNVCAVEHERNQNPHKCGQEHKECEKVVKIEESKGHLNSRAHFGNDVILSLSDECCHEMPVSSPPPSSPPKHKEFLCCDNCRSLKKRIIKLEEDLEKIQKIMPFCPKEHQESIKNCLENLNDTSGIFLKKLKSYTRMRYSEDFIKESTKCSKRSKSTPGPIVHHCQRKKLPLSRNNSICNMNIAMGITMENVDPVTGEKLGPETCWENKQEGNIQCALYKDDEEPVLMMDTDFSYNPQTGMLFSNQKHCPEQLNAVENPSTSASHSSHANTNTFSRSKETYDCLFLPEQSEFNQSSFGISGENLIEQGNTCSVETQREDLVLNPVKSRESEKGRKKRDSAKSRPSLESPLDFSEPVPESGGSKKNSKVSFPKNHNDKNENVSRIPIRRKATASCANSKVDSEFQKCSMSSVVNPMFSEGFFSKYEKSKKPHKLAKLFSFTWTFGFFLCKLVHYMQSVSAICSVLTLTAMSLERYYAIVHPMKAQYICTISQARRIITATWISAFLLAVPILFAQVHLRVGVKVEAYWCVRDWDHKTIWRAHELYMMLLILVVPTGVMAVAYTAICCEIWEVIQRRQDMTSGKGHGFCRKHRLSRNSSTNSFPSCAYGNNTIRLDNKRRGRSLLKKEPGDDGASVKQVIKMLVAVVVIYVLCWGPMLIDNVLQAYGILSHIRMGWLKYMGTTFHLMAYFNSCINPIIYGFMSKNFRESFRKTLCCGGKKPKTAYRSFSLSQTRNTSIRYAESSFGRTISIALPV